MRSIYSTDIVVVVACADRACRQSRIRVVRRVVQSGFVYVVSGSPRIQERY